MMKDELNNIFVSSLKHRAEHECGGYPYEHADVLAVLVNALNAQRILELGTGLGYTSSVMASSSATSHIDTIDQDSSHMEMAQGNWDELDLSSQITPRLGKAEAILPELSGPYDLIFFDGHVPSLKFLIQFERLLRKGGLLITANMFLRDQTGGKYMRALQKPNQWRLGVFADTALTVKLK